MKTLVTYRSSYGFTRTYAQWIAEALNADLAEAGDCPPSKAAEYGRIIYGGAVYAGRISGIDYLTKNPSLLQNKNLMIFFVGLASLTLERQRQMLASNGVPESLFPRCFYFRGGMDYAKFTFHHRLMMNVLRFFVSLKPNKSPETKAFLESFSKPVSFVSKEAIASLLEAAQK